MAKFVEGKKRLNGSFGYLQINGEDWGEVSGVSINVNVEYTDVQRGMDLDAKMTGRAGYGYSRKHKKGQGICRENRSMGGGSGRRGRTDRESCRE